MHGTRFHSRTQVPLTLAFAVTVHKCQGWTLPKVSIDVGKNEFSLGLTFVALIRVKSLSSIMLDPSDSVNSQWPRLLKINEHKGHKKRQEIDKLLQHLEASTQRQ